MHLTQWGGLPGRHQAALLDVNLVDGEPYELAAQLEVLGVPYAFLSASDPHAVPPALKPHAFFSKAVPVRELLAVPASLTGSHRVAG